MLVKVLKLQFQYNIIHIIYDICILLIGYIFVWKVTAPKKIFILTTFI